VTAVVAVARLWVRLYTAPLPRPVQERRRRELDADLWEHVDAGAGAGALLARLARGLGDDLAWSVATCAATAHPASHPRAVFALAVPSSALLWVVALACYRRGGLLEAVGTRAYHLSFFVEAATAVAAIWWLVAKAAAGRRG
jgi:hypothetical protein